MTDLRADDLVKLADELIAQNYGNVRDIDTMGEHFALLAKAASALRRLASSDGGVKVKPLVWRDHRPDSFPEPAWSAQTSFGFYNIEEVSASDSPAYVVRLHAHHFVADKDSLDDAKAAAQADYEARIRSALVEVPAVKGEPVRWEWCCFENNEQRTGWQCEGHGDQKGWEKLAESNPAKYRIVRRPLYTAPPADAGMREALERLKQGIRDIAQACVDGRVCDDVAWFTEIPAETLFDKCCNLLGEDLPTGQPALTAPGATTKSDGESFVTTNPDGSVTLDAYAGKSRDELKARCRELCSALNEWQFIAMEAATAHGNCLSNVPEHARAKIASMIEAYRDNDKPSPSDPSSTRSEVTVRMLASVLLDCPAGSATAMARALLDQFDIRRKK